MSGVGSILWGTGSWGALQVFYVQFWQRRIFCRRAFGVQELVLWSLSLGHNLTDDNLRYTKSCILSWCYTCKDDRTDDHLLLHWAVACDFGPWFLNYFGCIRLCLNQCWISRSSRVGGAKWQAEKPLHVLCSAFVEGNKRALEGLEKSMGEIKSIFHRSSSRMGFSPPFIRCLVSLFCLFFLFFSFFWLIVTTGCSRTDLRGL